MDGTRTTRRIVALGLVVAALALLAVVGIPRLRQEKSLDARHIPRVERSVLLVTMDTTRPDRLQPYGSENVETPTLQRLAETGIVFERANAATPITLPSHTSILTGLYPNEHGVRNNGIHYVPDRITTLAETLSEEGYRTAAFVSAAVLESRYGLDQGFEIYDDDLSTGRERHPRMVPDRPAEATIAAASAWLHDLDPTERFFLWVHLYDPHAPYSPPPPYRDRYQGRLYDGEIAYLDAQLEQLLGHPRVAADDPVIMVLGDHGESLGEHGEQTHAILAYESTLKVPWIARIPGGPEGMRFGPDVSQVDLVPTILDLLDHDPQPGLAGRSLVPLLEGAAPAQQVDVYSETYLPFYTYGWAKLDVLRRGQWKLINAPEPELYDLRRDPRELSNLADQEPGVLHDLKRDLAGRLEQAEGEEALLPLDTEAAERLRALGYLAVGSSQGGEDEERPSPMEMIDLHVGLERARVFIHNRFYEEAQRQLETVISRDPNNLAALVDLSSVQEELGNLEGAYETVMRALALDPDYVRLHLKLAGLETSKGNREKALAILREAERLDPRYPEIAVQQAINLEGLKRHEEAVTILERALEGSPDDPRLNTVYAQMVELQAGRLDAAEARLRRALNRDPFFTQAWRHLGEVLSRAGRLDEAKEAFQDGLKRTPDDGDLHARLGILLARDHAGAEAEAHLREAIRLSENLRPELHVSLGAWLAEQGKFAEAEAQYQMVLAEKPNHPAARNNRAIALYRSGRLQEAAAELEKLVEEHPGYADAHNNLAAVALDQGRWWVAEEHARAALAAGSSLPEAWNNLGIALSSQGRQEEALDAFRKARFADPGYWQAQFNLGRTLALLGRAQEAAASLQEVAHQVPNHPETHFELGKLYGGPLHDPEKARLHFNLVVKVAPTHPLAEDARRFSADLAQGLPLGE